jgi:hypothetical protein
MKEKEIQPGQSNDIGTPLTEDDWWTKSLINAEKIKASAKSRKYCKSYKLIAALKLNSEQQEQFFQLCLAHYIVLKDGYVASEQLNDPRLDASFNFDRMLELDQNNFVNGKAASQLEAEITEKRKIIGNSSWRIESAANLLSNIFLSNKKQGRKEIKQKVTETVIRIKI